MVGDRVPRLLHRGAHICGHRAAGGPQIALVFIQPLFIKSGIDNSFHYLSCIVNLLPGLQCPGVGAPMTSFSSHHDTAGSGWPITIRPPKAPLSDVLLRPAAVGTADPLWSLARWNLFLHVALSLTLFPLLFGAFWLSHRGLLRKATSLSCAPPAASSKPCC